MRSMFVALALAFGLIGMADFALASVYGRIYVPGHIRDGIYVRPHFVSAPAPEYGVWPAEPGATAPGAAPQPPLLDAAPVKEAAPGQPS